MRLVGLTEIAIEASLNVAGLGGEPKEDAQGGGSCVNVNHTLYMAGTSSLIALSSAFAQEAPRGDAQLDEVLVTAQR
jgi:hypothetical protein